MALWYSVETAHDKKSSEGRKQSRQKCQHDHPHQRTTRIEFCTLRADSLPMYQSQYSTSNIISRVVRLGIGGSEHFL